ncbi:MAG: hypothetical protein ACLP7P_10185 [Rhodomicrobium sp.]
MVREQEIAFLDEGIKKSKLPPAELGKVKEARDRAEALYNAGKYREARADRRAALTQLGYRSPTPTRTMGGGCGGTWVAPAD